MTRLSTRQWRDDDPIIATGKLNPYRPGCGAHERTNHALDAARRHLNFGQYKREFLDTGLTRATTLRTLVREGVIHPVTDPPPAGTDIVANTAADATTRAIWIGIREIGEQITRLADENLRRAA
jgi:hypothetical protein